MNPRPEKVIDDLVDGLIPSRKPRIVYHYTSAAGLDDIWYEVRSRGGHLPPHTYGHFWALKLGEDQRILRSAGSHWAAAQGLDRDCDYFKR